MLWCDIDVDIDPASGQVFQKFFWEIKAQSKDEYAVVFEHHGVQ